MGRAPSPTAKSTAGEVLPDGCAEGSFERLGVRAGKPGHDALNNNRLSRQVEVAHATKNHLACGVQIPSAGGAVRTHHEVTNRATEGMNGISRCDSGNEVVPDPG